MHSNDVVRQVEILSKLTIFCRATNNIQTFMSRQRLHYTITIKHLDTAKDAFSV